MSQGFLLSFLEFMSALFVFVIGTGVLLVVAIHVADSTQITRAIRRNYPVVGRVR